MTTVSFCKKDFHLIHAFCRFYLAFGFMILFMGCNRNEEKPPEIDDQTTKSTPQLEVIEVQTQTIIWPIHAVGAIEPKATVTISSRVAGQIEHLYIEEGDFVKRDMVIACLDSREFALQVEQATAKTASTQASLDLLNRGNRPEEIEALEAQLAQAEAAHAELLIDRTRNAKLVEQGLLSRQLYEDYLAKLDGAKAAVDQARASLKLGLKGFRDEEREGMRAQLNADEAALAIARERLSYATLTAPLDAYVAKRFSEAGEWINSGEPIFELVDNLSVRIVAHVAEMDVSQIHLGQSARVQLTALPGHEFSGVVEIIGEVLDSSSRTLPVKILVQNPERLLVPGMFAEVEINSPPQPESVVIPRDVIRYQESGPSVFLIANGVVEERLIQIGRRENGWIEVVNGLKNGDYVILSKPGSMKTNDLAEPILVTRQCPLVPSPPSITNSSQDDMKPSS